MRLFNQMLENANWAPTHKLTEPWRFTVFTGDGLKTFAGLQASVYKNSAGDNFKEDNYQKLLGYASTCIACYFYWHEKACR